MTAALEICRLGEFDTSRAMNRLVAGAAALGFANVRALQVKAWEEELSCLDSMVRVLLEREKTASNWGLLLEYPIPRRQKRIDAVLLAGGVVVVIEFKTGAARFESSAVSQVEDYALDLHDFHRASQGRPIVPVLVATRAVESEWMSSSSKEGLNGERVAVLPVVRVTPESLPYAVHSAYQRFSDAMVPIEPPEWDGSEYHPILSILEAAEALYAGHMVDDIYHAYADNMAGTLSTVAQAIEDAAQSKRRVACFITGVPGSGKTLLGLSLAHDRRLVSTSGFGSVFLSGNGPLVRTVKRALVSDAAGRNLGLRREEAVRQVSTFIQNVHSFIDFYSRTQPGAAPAENAIVFDEAQRAWTAAKVSKKHPMLTESEPRTLLRIMERRPDWSVIVALVGGGQEIHEGEGGLAEWGKAIADSSISWTVLAAPEAISGGVSLAGNRLFENDPPKSIDFIQNPNFHLSVSVRSYRAHATAEWVNAVIEGDSAQARIVSEKIREFPLVLTRELGDARRWLRAMARGRRRPGLLASSGALRLRAYGLELSTGFRRAYDYGGWFLSEKDDVRSSHSLEVAATEFECQGLELDWVGLCWGGDFVIDLDKKGWIHRKFRGTRWIAMHDNAERAYLANKYRVLLTRAREGIVVWVPRGDPDDPTLEPSLFDSVADYLSDCGVPDLEAT